MLFETGRSRPGPDRGRARSAWPMSAPWARPRPAPPCPSRMLAPDDISGHSRDHAQRAVMSAHPCMPARLIDLRRIGPAVMHLLGHLSPHNDIQRPDCCAEPDIRAAPRPPRPAQTWNRRPAAARVRMAISSQRPPTSSRSQGAARTTRASLTADRWVSGLPANIALMIRPWPHGPAG